MELVNFDIASSYLIYVGGFFLGLVLYFIAYSVYAIFKAFNEVSRA